MGSRKLCRMQLLIVLGVVSFMAQKKTVGSGIKKLLVLFLCGLSSGKGRSRSPGKWSGLYAPHQITGRLYNRGSSPPCRTKVRNPELISGFTAGEDLFFCQPVAVYVCVPASNPAVIAVISAVVCKFNESPDIDIMSVELNPRVVIFQTDMRQAGGCTHQAAAAIQEA